jgi:ABC-2 type transport system permease protein
MSALGGCMYPRVLMSETMQRAGLVTLPAWALDGWVKVLWRDAPASDLLPELTALAAFTAALLASARILARRWERL